MIAHDWLRPCCEERNNSVNCSQARSGLCKFEVQPPPKGPFARNIWISKRAAYSEDIENPLAGRVEVAEMAKRLFPDARKEIERGGEIERKRERSNSKGWMLRKRARWLGQRENIAKERWKAKSLSPTLSKRTSRKSIIIRRTIRWYLHENLQILTRSIAEIISLQDYIGIKGNVEYARGDCIAGWIAIARKYLAIWKGHVVENYCIYRNSVQ